MMTKIKDMEKERREAITNLRERLKEIRRDVYIAERKSAEGERLDCQRDLMIIWQKLDHITAEEMNDEAYSHL